MSNITKVQKQQLKEALTNRAYLEFDETEDMFVYETYVDYNDEEVIQEIVSKGLESFKIGEGSLIDAIRDIEMDMLDNLHMTDYIYYNEIVDNIEGYVDEETLDYFKTNMHDIVYIDFAELDYVKDMEIDVDIVLSTYNERNSDNTMICDAVDIEEPTPEELREILVDTGIGVLMELQNRNINELYANGEKDSFILGLEDEIVNISSALNQMTIFTRATVIDLINFEEGKGDLVVSNDSLTGLFTPWSGTGSLLNIALDKDIVIKKRDVINSWDEGGNIEIVSSRYFGYSMESVYGISGSKRGILELI